MAEKMTGEQEQRQAEIDDLMIRHARAGKTVVRLKGGDPFIFGRGGEEALTLVEAGINFEVVPGITSAIAAPAYAGIPLTHRSYSSSVAFVTGHSAALKADSAIHWEQLATGVDTLVILMGVGHLREIAGRLIQHGRSPETPISLVHWGTTPQQKTLEGTLADIAQKAETVNFRNPAAIVVGDVNILREQLRWFDQKPLFGRGIIVTRARAQASDFAECLESYGAEVIQFPTIETLPIFRQCRVGQGNRSTCDLQLGHLYQRQRRGVFLSSPAGKRQRCPITRQRSYLCSWTKNRNSIR